mmetsp:Transcript_42364/g.95728  ORF Transcript_42364/g.95728 Transcript_42364/m.95728 type:complete len:174 (-) Transcript_42364:295-816(-)
MIYTFDSATSGKSDDVTVYVDGRKMPLSGIGGPGQGSGNANPFQGGSMLDQASWDTVIGTQGKSFRIGDFNRFAADGGRNWCFSFHGYLADTWFVSGEKLGPSDFGTLSVGTEGDQVFTPSAGPSASLTANSFHLNYADGGDLGKDISGLGNHFTNHRVTQGNGGAAVVITGA